MRILIYGAGTIGSLYAALLAEGGCQVSVLARGKRLAELREHGLLYLTRSGPLRAARVKILEALAPEDRYDYIFLTVRTEQAGPALLALRENVSPTIVTMVNTIEPYEHWETLCGKGRLLPAFPGGGGCIENGVLDAALTPRLIQPTTFGEISGRKTERATALKRLLQRAGIPCQIVPDMGLWQICHLGLVVPLADAYYAAAEPSAVWREKAVIAETARLLRVNFRALHRKYGKLSPAKLELLRWCPSAILASILSLVYKSDFGKRFMFRHAMKAPQEMDQLHRQYYALMGNERKG